MPILFDPNLQPLIVTTKGPSEGYIDSKWCRKVLSAVWVVALEEPTYVGEVIASVTTVVIGGIIMYEYLVCRVEDPDTVSGSNMESLDGCIALFEKCRNEGDFHLPCDVCLARCRVEGIWTIDLCPAVVGSLVQ